MTSTRKPQRPRLERKQGSRVAGWVLTHTADDVHFVAIECGQALGRKDITRLRKFLEKCEAYLTSRAELAREKEEK